MIQKHLIFAALFIILILRNEQTQASEQDRDALFMMEEKTLFMSTKIQDSRGYSKPVADSIVYLGWWLTAQSLCSEDILTHDMLVEYAERAAKRHSMEGELFMDEGTFVAILFKGQLRERSSLIPPFCEVMWDIRKKIEKTKN